MKGKTVGELGVILDELITKGLDANIELDNIENKTVIEQIVELRTKLAQKDGEQKLYFVLESKGTNTLFNLRTPEKLKIHCGKQHFDSLDNIKFSEEPVKDWKEFKVSL